jgi:anti-anti-sigma regulatory factor
MRVRIIKTTSEAGTVIRVDGRLAKDSVADLERECQSAEGRLYVDLTNLLSADASGIEALRTLAESGARLMGESPYIRLQLERSEDE